MRDITEEDYRIVKELRAEGLSDGMIALRFDTTPKHVRNIRNVPEGMF